MSWVASEVVALGNRASIRSRFKLSRIARGLPGLETKHAYGRRARNAHGLPARFQPVAHRATPTSATTTSTPSLSACQCRRTCLWTVTR